MSLSLNLALVKHWLGTTCIHSLSHVIVMERYSPLHLIACNWIPHSKPSHLTDMDQVEFDQMRSALDSQGIRVSQHKTSMPPPSYNNFSFYWFMYVPAPPIYGGNLVTCHSFLSQCSLNFKLQTSTWTILESHLGSNDAARWKEAVSTVESQVIGLRTVQ